MPIVGLALTGCAIATYLALYQWRVFTDVWEPFFGDGSRTILNSSVSHILPIPDAALGAFGYFLDAATGIVGGRARWRTMPWMVVIFGLAVGPLGFVSVMLVIFQPVLFEAWCTLCLASALVSVLMIGPAADEVLASLQYLKREQVRGNSLWRAFWGLDQPEIGGRKSVRPGLRSPPPQVIKMVWAQIINALLGVWLMASPAFFNYDGSARTNDLIVGPIAATFAIVAIWEVTRPVGKANILLGLWLVVAPWALGYGSVIPLINHFIVGLTMIALAMTRVQIAGRFGGGWSSLGGTDAEAKR